MTVIGLAREHGRLRRSEPNIRWDLAARQPVSRWRQLASRFPAAALRSWGTGTRTALIKHLREERWDSIVLDSINVAWALPHVLAYRRRRPQTRILYLAQNDETEAALAIARAEHGVKRMARLADACKTRWLERWLVRSVDVACADSPDDCRTLNRYRPDKSVSFVPPGYAGSISENRVIDRSVPRRAIVVGSFDWAAKRASLEAFLEQAAGLFARHAIALQIVGRTEDAYAAWLRQRFPSVDVVGTVSDPAPYLADARIALVPDVLGGFKLKTLDYVFSRTPIFAIEGAVPGLPLEPDRGLRLCGSHSALAHAVVGAIDDVATLNEQQNLAFELCAHRFDWDVIGEELLALMHPPPPPWNGMRSAQAASRSAFSTSAYGDDAASGAGPARHAQPSSGPAWPSAAPAAPAKAAAWRHDRAKRPASLRFAQERGRSRPSVH
jgi:glycosyltransferase involved in cell wall biosynthesis